MVATATGATAMARGRLMLSPATAMAVDTDMAVMAMVATGGATATARGRLRLSPATAMDAATAMAVEAMVAPATGATAMARGRLRLMPPFSTLVPTTTATLVP